MGRGKDAEAVGSIRGKGADAKGQRVAVVAVGGRSEFRVRAVGVEVAWTRLEGSLFGYEVRGLGSAEVLVRDDAGEWLFLCVRAGVTRDLSVNAQVMVDR